MKTANSAGRHAFALVDLGFLIVFVAWIPVFLAKTYVIDDLVAFSADGQRSYFQILTESHGWAGTAFYRPVIDLLTKFLLQVSGGDFYWFKLAQMAFFATALGMLRGTLRRLQFGPAITLGSLCLVVGSIAVQDAFLWWVNIGMALVLISFLAALNLLIDVENDEKTLARGLSYKTMMSLGCISAVAIFSKEVGLIVLFMGLVAAYRYKAWTLAGGLFLLFAAFVAARIFFIGSVGSPDGFIASGGLGTRFLESSALREIFDGNKYLYYMHNVVVQTVYIFFKQPINGQFLIHRGLLGFWTVAYVLSCLVMIVYTLRAKPLLRSYFFLILFAAILLNGTLSFPYPRQRIMIVGDISFCLLIGMAALAWMQDASRHSGKSASQVFRAVVPLALVVIYGVSLMTGYRTLSATYSSGLNEMHAFLAGDHTTLFEGAKKVDGIDERVYSLAASHYRDMLALLR
ncbi:hypothetical protein SAMN05216350_10861 [Polaromonas sp. YR568]|uniref:hypothetical protein n=1 Tax=Polaromonas sp. YR568 TaxID=1855301 RepID=UPI0008F2C924|nr:hypothetical protein [Polaromonas sp. YR568]SFU91492.1 hypothetical protein SAMN05216350_10861 [Polaromonas sp. YR568]